jgi:uncharacterized damage-inducible protein DinB
MFKDHFIHLFKYNDWATRQTAESIMTLKNKNSKLEELLLHTISAQKIWLNRILKRDIIIDPWQKINSDEWIEQNMMVTSEWINLIESFQEKDFAARVEYKNTAGEKYTNMVKDIITHVINHSTYHRAQIALLVRQSGSTPARTDYIVYQREFQNH